MTQTLDLGYLAGEHGSSATLTAYLAEPSGEGPWPGVVVIHEAFGLTDTMRRAADRVAALGYLALAPDLYSRGSMPRCIRSTMRALRRGEGDAFGDLAAARAGLLADARCSGAVAVLGFCMGGGFALLLANRGYRASAVNYGMLPDELDEALEGACPIVASYGGRDRYLAGAADRLRDTLLRRGVPNDVKEYPDAGHSFLNDVDDSPWFLRPVVGTVLHGGPVPASAEDAWKRIGAFFATHLAS